jgi:hypothetical protein
MKDMDDACLLQLLVHTPLCYVLYIQVLRHSHSVSYLEIAYTLDNWIGASLVNNLAYIFLVQETC